MAYIECPSCGKTALRVASRCPHCGLNFSPDMIPPAEPHRLRRRLIIAGALLVLAAVFVVGRNRTEPRAAPPVTVIAPTIAVRPPASAPDTVVDSTPLPTAPPPEAEPPPATPSPAASPPTAPTGEQLRRYAKTWVNIRGRRTPNADPVRVLDPGEAVFVDSLVGGWYRVVIDGQPIGYADGSNLSERAP